MTGRVLALFSLILLLLPHLPASANDLLPASVQILTRDDFEARPYASVADALEQAFGVHVQRAGGPGTRAVANLRGRSGGDGTLVLIDGRPLTHVFDGAVDLSQIPINIVERIEITRGGASVAYGSEAAGGTIHIVTSRPSRSGLSTRIGTSVGRDGYKDAHGRLLGRSHWGDLTYLGSQQTSSGFSDNEDHRMDNHFVNVSRSFNGRGYWAAEYYNGESRVGLSEGTAVPFDQWNGRLEQIPADAFAQNRQILSHVRFDVASATTPAGTFRGTVVRSVREAENRASPDGPALRDQKSTADLAQIRWSLGRVEGGVEAELRELRIFPFGSRHTTRTAAYGFATWSSRFLTFRPGVRVDRDTRTGEFISPRLSVIAHPSPLLAFSVTAQRLRRAPAFEQLFVSSAAASNADLDDAEVRSFDAGVRWTPAPDWMVETTAFVSDASDRIGVDPGSGRWENVGDEKSRGVETAARIDLGNATRFRHVTLTASWTFQKTTRTGLDTVGEQESPLSPREFGFVRLDYHLPREITFTNELRYQSERFESAGRGGVRLPSATVWNSRIAIHVLSADLFFEARNLNRERYAETLGVATTASGARQTVLSPRPERTFWLGIAVAFQN